MGAAFAGEAGVPAAELRAAPDGRGDELPSSITVTLRRKQAESPALELALGKLTQAKPIMLLGERQLCNRRANPGDAGRAKERASERRAQGWTWKNSVEAMITGLSRKPARCNSGMRREK